ncbi:MAG TPA: DUF72 domain-containing protein [Syntrophorhabdaceae bacterium]|nr:DUF72 domain-containing protein [Syntrophorhabdaceae bacterium]
MGQILIGTSGFSFDDWVGTVYPQGIKKHEMLPYYEKSLGFRALEINYTYYSMPSERTMESFAQRTSRDFSFVVKAHKTMTHERTENVKEVCRRFRAGVAPLKTNLKASLFQFPFMFVPSDENVGYLRTLREELADYESIVEFRNARWSAERYWDMLKQLGYGYCIVDEPKLKGLLPFSPVLTSRTGYFRFHGRNTSWFKEPVEVRYDYLYSEQELSRFVAPIQDIAAQASTTFVFFNNCHAGKAAKNAMMMAELLDKKPGGITG